MGVEPIPAEDGVSAGSRPDPLLDGALEDLEADLRELEYLCGDGERKLVRLESQLATACPRAPTRELIARTAAGSRRRYRAAGARLRLLRREAEAGPASASLVDRLAGHKASLADLLRAEQALLAGVLSAADWQSPSYQHSLLPAAGRQTGRVAPHWNDYKRDRHADAEVYERRYVEALIDGPPGLRALLTSCGMAALTTVLWWLLSERRVADGVVAVAGIYHESRLLLEHAVPGRVRFVDEHDTGALLAALERPRPGAVFLDSVSSSASMPVPALAAVIDRLRGRDTYVIVDNTALSVGCQPFALAGASVRLVMIESLLKYAQLGLDRANAGVIVSRADDATALERHREHLGTNLADTSVHALPWPDRSVLERRLARLQRNAQLLAARLGDRVPSGVRVVYPGLRSHPCAHAAAPPGGLLAITFEPGSGRAGREEEVAKNAVAIAARRGVALLAGSSFGFDTTRIYPVRADARGEPFVRIAAGTEDRVALRALADVFAAAVETVSR